jgi:hypothetical protein
MAAATLRLDRWEAGARLMQTADPASWNELAAALRLERDNRAKLEDCKKAVLKTGRPQNCSVILDEGAAVSEATQ